MNQKKTFSCAWGGDGRLIDPSPPHFWYRPFIIWKRFLNFVHIFFWFKAYIFFFLNSNINQRLLLELSKVNYLHNAMVLNITNKSNQGSRQSNEPEIFFFCVWGGDGRLIDPPPPFFFTVCKGFLFFYNPIKTCKGPMRKQTAGCEFSGHIISTRPGAREIVLIRCVRGAQTAW